MTADDRRDSCSLLHHFVERSALQFPALVAIDVPPGTGRSQRIEISYAELAARTRRLGSFLRPHVMGECQIAILLPRHSEALYVAQIAALKAGAAYVCIDPSFPDERMRTLLEDSEAVALLTDAAGVERMGTLIPEGMGLLDLAALAEGGEEVGPAVDPEWLRPSSLAYSIYTSGTTGRPKGVLIEHHSIVNLVRSDLDEFGLGPGDRVAQGSSAAYDSSVEEIWLALASGATLVVMDEDTARLGPDLIPWLQRERISVFCPPPTLLRATGCEHPEIELPLLKLLYVGGEALPTDVVDRWAPGRRLVNGYGPTECTVTSLRGDVTVGRPITIGTPVAGLSAWALDEHLNPVADDIRGELFLGGAGLARGYWKRPELTAERFIEHPTYGRLYRTGDLVHRDALGQFHYHGRIDSQVKIRGYRVELEEIESHLASCPGVRAAACCAQETSGKTILVAFVVPQDPEHPPDPASLKSSLEAGLPGYMVPARVGMINALPSTVGGKLNRAALPRLESSDGGTPEQSVSPRNAIEARIASAFQLCLHLTRPVSIHEDFFSELGGDSLSAAAVVSRLREVDQTAWITVRDIYESRTVAELAACADRAPQVAEDAPPVVPGTRRDEARPVAITLVQALWSLSLFSVASWIAYGASLHALPWFTEHLSLIPCLALGLAIELVLFALYAVVSVAFAVMMKRVLIGRYEPIRAPVWSPFYLRNWIVQRVVSLVPWRAFEGTRYQLAALRALGARVGQRVHIQRGVDLLQGGWDLLEIGDDVTLCRDAELRLVELDAGDIVIAPIRVGAGATLDIRSGVGGDTVVGEGAHLTPLSSLASGQRIPAGQCWDGIPARAAGTTPRCLPLSVRPGSNALAQHDLILGIAKITMSVLMALPTALLGLSACVLQGVSAVDVWTWMSHTATGWTPWVFGVAIVLLAVPLTLIFEALLSRALGRVREGCVHVDSLESIRIRLKTDLVESAGRWLSGTLFWPTWLRAAGMRVGKGCEISTIIDVVPELIELGDQTFLADGIYLGGPRIHQGVITLAKTRLGRNTFLGNHVVIPAGQHLPEDILLGVCTVADDAVIRTGTSWFGLPPFELPRREVVNVDRSLTHEPSSIRYVNRFFWEASRGALPLIPLLVLVSWFRGVAALEASASPIALWVGVPLSSLAAVGALCLVVVALKWILLGRVRPGQHALWSCWCSRWDFLYVAWGQYAARTLSALEGSLLLSWYLRAMGMEIGKRVVLGRGFAQVVDPDMIHIADDATVSAVYQAHTFEDRVLKIDHVYVRRGATLGSNSVPLYGADVGEGAHVAAHSVIMKGEHLLPRRRYEGAPTR